MKPNTFLRVNMQQPFFENMATMQTLLDVLPVAIFVKDAQSKLLLMNKACEEQWGVSFSELEGTDGSQFFPADQMKTFLAEDRETFLRGHQVDFEEEFCYAERTQTIFRHTLKKPVFDAYGKPLYLICINIDISERKKAEMLSIQHKTAIDISHDGFWIVDARQGILLEANPSYARMSGYSLDELKGMQISLLEAKEQSQEEVQAHINNIIAQGWDVFETRHRRKDGVIIDIEVSSAFIKESGQIVAFLRDITERRRTQLELQKTRESTHRNVLVKEVHHRIKNNLQGIVGVLRQHSEAHPELTEPINRAIGQVQSVAVIHGLQGRTGMSEVRLCELTSAIASGKEALWNTIIAVDIPSNWSPFIILETEAVPIALILNELIANALKHSTDGIVTISLRTASDNDAVIVTIRNSGLIPAGFGLNSFALLGTGLSLVSSLMPQSGARLYWEQDKEHVVTKFELCSPIIHPDLSDHANIANETPQQ
jgi:PAS domain S-box-containing protein